MLPLATIKQVTAAQAGIPVSALLGPKRVRAFAWPRQRAMYISRQLRPDCSFPMIGREFGQRDHTTVMHAVEAVQTRLADDPAERAQVEAILAALAPIADIHGYIARLSAEITTAEQHLAALQATQGALLQLIGGTRP